MNSDAAEKVLRGITELAKRSLVGVADASLTVIAAGEAHTAAFTGPIAVHLDQRQYELGFGPCLDAARTGQTIVVGTDSTRSSYREFARSAHRAGVRHTVAVGLPLAQPSIAGLNIYRDAGAAPDPSFVTRAEILASYAAIAVNNITSDAVAIHDKADLLTALRSRVIIEQARGVLVARDRCTPDEAFDLLRRISHNDNITLQQLAQIIVDETQR